MTPVARARVRAIANGFVDGAICICLGVALAMIGMSTGVLP